MTKPIRKSRSSKSKLPSWKSHQSTTQVKSRVVLGLMALVIVIGIVLVGKLINLVGSLTRPDLVENQAFSRNYSWDGRSNLNLIIKSSELSFVSLDPNQETLTIIKIPDETYLNVGLGYGNWQAGSIYKLGQGEKIPVGGPLLKVALTNALAVPIDGYIVFEGDLAQKSIQDIVEDLRSNPTQTISLIHAGNSDLSPLEELQLWWTVKGIRFDKVQDLDLSQLPATKWVMLSDGTRVMQLDQQNLDQTLASFLEEKDIIDERVSVAVFNSTPHPLLAEKVARMVTNLGGRVVLTSSINYPQEQTLVIGKESLTFNRLRTVLSPACTKKQLLFLTLEDSCAKITSQLVSDSESLKQSLERAEVTIIVGEDYYSRLIDRPSAD